MTLTFDGEQIPLSLSKSSKGRLLYRFKRNSTTLEIHTPDGKLDSQIREILHQNKSWIIKQYRNRKLAQGKRQDFFHKLEQDKVLYRGEDIELKFLKGNKRWVKLEENCLWISVSPKDRHHSKEAILFGALKALAKNHLTQRTEKLALHTKSQFEMIRVKNVKSKWGSCSSKRNLNFNWHLIFLPDALIDYIIVHELMHLRELNHSKAFWAWVGHFYPDYKAAEAQLQHYEWLIGIFDET